MAAAAKLKEVANRLEELVEAAEKRGDSNASQRIERALKDLTLREQKLAQDKRAAFEKKDFELCKRITQEVEDATKEAQKLVQREEDIAAKPAPGPAAAEEDTDADAAIAKAIAMSLEEEGRGGSPMEPRQRSIDFERYGRDIVVNEETVKEIEAYHSVREPYVDPQFPPASKSLYIDPDDAVRWICQKCKHSNPNPEVPKPAATREEAELQQAQMESIACTNCGSKPTHVQLAHISFMRPEQWLRPGEHCEVTQAVWGAQAVRMGATDGGKEVVSRMCTNYLRDEFGQTVGQPWAIMRGDASPDDVVQGALGNCWWGSAVSSVAQKPWLIDRLFVTKKFNPLGVYHVRLFFGGRWRDLLIDDLLPCTKSFEGKIEGSTLHYSRGGTLTFAPTRRRSLWVPLLEKANAKLVGSYGALHGGNTAEAIQTLTGFPVVSDNLFVPEEYTRRKRERQQRRETLLTELLLAGRMDELAEMQAQKPEPEEFLGDDDLWLKLLSSMEAGFLMTVACHADAIGSTKPVLEMLGLQSPHAYGVLDARSVSHQGKELRLVKIRNPWGERAPRTWRGDWSPTDKVNWTYGLKREMKLITGEGDWIDDTRCIFWMTFSDFRRYFYRVSICRVRTGWQETAADAWLPSDLRPGDCFDITVFSRTRVDLSMWQERGNVREAAVGARSTNLDVGFVLLRKKGEVDGKAEWECCQQDWYTKRTTDDVAVSDSDIFLEGGVVYRVVPLCFNQMQISRRPAALRKVRLVVHSDRPVEINAVENTWWGLAQSLHAAARTAGTLSTITPGVKEWHLRDRSSGFLVVTENTGDKPVVLQWDLGDAVGVQVTRAADQTNGMLVLPARSRQVAVGVSVLKSATMMQYGWQEQVLPSSDDLMMCSEPNVDMHQVMPLTDLALSTTFPEPDPDILKRAPPSPPPEPLGAAAAAGETDDAELKAAISMSMELEGGDTEMTAEEEIAKAIAMSEEDLTEEEQLARAIRMSIDDPENRS